MKRTNHFHGNAKNLLGQTFGLLTVVGSEPTRLNGKIVWHCVCECGGTKYAPTTRLTTGTTKSCGCLSTKGRPKPKREKSGAWKGGRYTDKSSGYVYVYVGGQNNNYRLEHRVVMEQILGRPLLRSENVHHINGNRSDNTPDNLQLWTSFQPPRQAVPDLIEYCSEFLRRYAPERLKS